MLCVCSDDDGGESFLAAYKAASQQQRQQSAARDERGHLIKTSAAIEPFTIQDDSAAQGNVSYMYIYGEPSII